MSDPHQVSAALFPKVFLVFFPEPSTVKQVFFIGDLNYRIDEMETEEILSLANAADPQVGAPLHLTES